MLRRKMREDGNGHGNCVCSAGAGVLFPLALLCALSCSAVTIRTKGDVRLWQTVADRSVPLAWTWADGADSATLVFSNRVTRKVSSVNVPRGASAARGSCGQPVPQMGEAVVDVTLVQTGGGNEVARERATLAYVFGAGGGPITLRAMGPPERELARLQGPRVYAFDPAWLGEAGDSGYDIAWPIFAGLKLIFR